MFLSIAGVIVLRAVLAARRRRTNQVVNSAANSKPGQQSSDSKEAAAESSVGDTIPVRTLRFVVASDTHCKHGEIPHIPPGDVFIHCGDFTTRGTLAEVSDFNAWLGTLPHKHKIVIAGNHELALDAEFYRFVVGRGCVALCDSRKKWKSWHKGAKEDPDVVKAALTNCTYLAHSEVIVEGLKLFGTPWQPPAPHRTMAFNMKTEIERETVFASIPDDVDVLITHTPPYGVLDVVWRGGVHVGCKALGRALVRVKPKVHVFGHIHESYGECNGPIEVWSASDEPTAAIPTLVHTDTRFINAALCDEKYKLTNAPIVFDVQLPLPMESK